MPGRAGTRYRPANDWLAHEFIAEGMLGIDLDTQPRWG